MATSSSSGASKANLLHRIVTGLESSRLVFVEYKVATPINRLLGCFLKRSDKYKNLLLLESNRRFFPLKDINDIELIDAFDSASDESFPNLLEIVGNVCDNRNEDLLNKILIIDSINPLLLCGHGIASICTALENLSKRYELVVFAACKQLYDSITQTHLRRLSTTHIDFSFDPSSKYFKALVTHKKRHKRLGLVLSTSSEQFLITDDHTIDTQAKIHAPPKLAEDTSQEMAGLTFNLNLRESEKKARENLELPYVKKESQVIYYPDKDDDIDEDDPDDDLDI